ncbi:hypothetical protein EDB82DRAFT_247320 [Fusarium venenatum]|uniref:uncharacterized protein n=1 Tax=Fusarium venenatum TaxID=56646 RepID=UPI001DAA9EB0|nr:hypothetical protein EDB82DRAFT_247320 [Fusarium venenatum]
MSESTPTLYPGLGLDLRYHDQDRNDIYPIGIHYNCYGADSEMLLVREVAMMIVMNQLTEKPDWHLKVFNETIAEKWIEEALALPVEPLYDDIVPPKKYNYTEKLKTILDRKCLEYCIKELRAKAKFFEKTGLIPTLDASASVVKADGYIDDSLHQNLQAAFAKLKLEQKDDPDWHPNTNEMVQNLVHPSLYPLVYGRSRVFRDEVVGVEDAIDRWSGKGDVIPKKNDWPVDMSRSRYSTGIGGGQIHDSYWSENYQWLPSNVNFQDDSSAKFTSYINGLHPTEHPEIYATIEKLIDRAITAWDLCVPCYLTGEKDGAGRTEPRFGMPENPDDENDKNWTVSLDDIPLPKGENEDDKSDSYRWEMEDRQREQWEEVREPIQPEAPEFKAWDYGVKPACSFRERYPDIQVIVKMASIELTPDKPTFPAGGWHVEGQMNEHIVGTALYYLDSENVTPSSLKFRMQTSPYQDKFQDSVGQGQYNWMELVYGTALSGGDCLQQYGSVETKEGRLLAFPNVFHHCVSPFELQDKTKPGHRRFIALWLVDPHTRIINTGNVPPQQHSWWMEKAFGNLDAEKSIPHPVAKIVSEAAPDHSGIQAAVERGTPLPAELMSMVQKEAGESAMPMTLQEAKEHRLKLMQERSRSQQETEQKWSKATYSFCEH